MRKVPPNIIKPDYAETGVPSSEQQKRADKRIETKSAEDIEKMKVACLKARKVLDYAHSLVEPGVTTNYIDEQTHEFIINQDCYPSPLNYRGFPKSLCTSVNEVICHGIPDSRKLEEGDIVNIDITVYYDGFHGDCNETYCVGRVAESSKHLVSTTYDCLMKSIEVCKPGQLYRNIGNTIQQVADAAGLSVVRTFTGHGIGRLFHTAPSVPHYGNNNATGTMKAGHTFTIEPMINQGTWKDVIWEDDWTACTADGMRSAQFEHTLLIVPGGVEILTARLPESPKLEFMLE